MKSAPKRAVQYQFINRQKTVAVQFGYFVKNVESRFLMEKRINVCNDWSDEKMSDYFDSASLEDFNPEMLIVNPILYDLLTDDWNFICVSPIFPKVESEWHWKLRKWFVNPVFVFLKTCKEKWRNVKNEKNKFDCD